MTGRKTLSHPLIVLKDAAVRDGERLVFAETNWTVRADENWAIVGPNGSGKSLLIRALAGELPVVRGDLTYHFPEQDAPEEQVAHVSFDDQRDLVGQFSPYQQARWHSMEGADAPRVEEMLAEDETGPLAEFLVDPPPADPSRRRRIGQIWEQLGIRHLLRRRIVHLSNGEMRKVLIARALVRQPRLLVLDDPLAGLDRRSQQALRKIIARLMAGATGVILVTSRVEELPPAVTHVLCVHQERVIAQGKREMVLRSRAVRAVMGGAAPVRLRQGGRRRRRPVVRTSRGAELVRIAGARVKYGRATVLDGIDWIIRTGQRWALLGPNGSGKTALLSLILADNPQAYANDVRLLGQPRGAGCSVWDVKKHIGAVSPEMLIHYREPITCYRVVCSGFFDSVGLYRTCSAAQRVAARAAMERLGVAPLARRDFTELSSGRQRMVLIARAMVKSPSLLILDEPCQGLDPANTARIRRQVDTACAGPETALIYVTHRLEELPTCITHILKLRDGKSVRKGTRKAVFG